jgi:outer membrane protein TolC
MKKTKFFALIFLLFLLPISISAQEVLKLNLEEAVKMGISESRDFQIIKKRFESSQAKYRSQKITYYLPTLSFSSNLPSYSFREDLNYIGGFQKRVLVSSRTASYDGSLNLNQKLFTGGNFSLIAGMHSYDYRWLSSRPNPLGVLEEFGDTTKEAQANLSLHFEQPLLRFSQTKNEFDKNNLEFQKAQLAYSSELNEFRKTVVKAYFDLLIAKKETEINSKKFLITQMDKEGGEKKAQDGVISEADLMKLKTAELEAKISLLDQRDNLEKLKENLLALLKISSDKTVELNDEIDLENLIREKGDLSSKNIEDCAEFENGEIDAQIKKLDWERQKGQGGLEVNLTGDYALLGRGDVWRKSLDDLRKNQWGFGLNITYPLWDGGLRHATLESAYLSYEQAKVEFEKKKIELSINLKSQSRKINTNAEKVELLKQEKEIQEKLLSQAQEKKEIGIISEKQLYETEISLAETEIKYLNACLDLYTALIDWDKLWGKVPENL